MRFYEKRAEGSFISRSEIPPSADFGSKEKPARQAPRPHGGHLPRTGYAAARRGSGNSAGKYRRDRVGKFAVRRSSCRRLQRGRNRDACRQRQLLCVETIPVEVTGVQRSTN